MVEEEPGYDEAEMLQITPRQYEVLVLLARGYPIKTVSRMLNISVATVKSHACTLYQRLKVRKGEAVYAACSAAQRSSGSMATNTRLATAVCGA
jgi:DNA-binding NarL/FixJ family response regulator